MMSKYMLIKEFLEPPFLIEYATRALRGIAPGEADEAEGQALLKMSKRKQRPRKPDARPHFARAVGSRQPRTLRPHC